jgi:hypothetical protein
MYKMCKMAPSSIIELIAAVLMAMALLSAAAFAQQTTGNVRGLIKDQTGAVVASARVTILDKKTNNALTTQSTGSGEYEFKNLLAGDYQITVEAQGFKKSTLTDVRVQLNQTTDVGVQPGAHCAERHDERRRRRRRRLGRRPAPTPK